MKEKYRQALSEVYIILKNTDEEIKNRIPDKFIDFVKNNMDTNYKFELKPGKELVEQNLRLETKQILALIYRDYICEEEERKRLLEQENEKSLKESSKDKEKYDVNFVKENNKNKEELEEKKSNVNKTALIKLSKEKWYKKLLNKILKIFKIKNN